MELFGFTHNLVLKSFFAGGHQKTPCYLSSFLRLHKVQIREELILHLIHIEVTGFIEAGTGSLSRGNKLGWMMGVLNPLQFVPLYQGAVVISAKLDPWISNWWGDILISLSAKDWLEYKEGKLL